MNDPHNNVLDEILAEVKKLREEVLLLVPHESLDEYENQDDIEASYKEAIKPYPRSWK